MVKKENMKKVKKELTKQVEGKYEITMYKLLIVFAVTMFVMLGVGMLAGDKIGFSRGVDAVNIGTPSYCHAEAHGSEVKIVCNELEGFTADELCDRVSPTLLKNIKILITTSESNTTG